MPKSSGKPEKWPTPEARKAACQKLVKHLESGLSLTCFPDACWQTIENYTERFPEDFPPDDIASAKRKGLETWERIGLQGTCGKLKGFNAASWIFNMKNRASWRDAVDISNPDGSLKPDGDINYHFYDSLSVEKKRQILDIIEGDD